MNDMGTGDQLEFLKKQVRARFIGRAFTYDEDMQVSASMFSTSKSAEQIKKLKATAEKMMLLEQDPKTRLRYTTPDRAPIKVSRANVPPLGNQVKRTERYDLQAAARLEALRDQMDVDDEELVNYETQLLDPKIWDDDENTNKRYQIMAVSYDPQGDFFQAECVILDKDEKVDRRHIKRGDDGLYSRMVAYRFTGPGYFTIESLLNMAEDYKREHAKAAARQRQNGERRPRLSPNCLSGEKITNIQTSAGAHGDVPELPRLRVAPGVFWGDF